MMKMKNLIKLTMAGLLTISMTAAAYAGNADETRNLFENAGKKQVGADFKPAPDKIETNFGTLNFELIEGVLEQGDFYICDWSCREFEAMASY